MTRFFALAGLMIGLALAGGAQAAKIPIKVVVITTFEAGEDTGDRPGEFQAWAERMPLTETAVVPGIERPVRYSKDGVLGIVAGMRARPRESLAALISGDQFDVSHAYWIVAGIAGIDPRAGSIGSAAWARYVVDADPIYEMDERETPASWPYGLYSLATTEPNKKGSAAGSSGMVWKLDDGLVDWAFGLTRAIALPDNDDLKKDRAGFASEPAAIAPPKVMIGDNLGTTRFWHGDKRTQWARDWVKLWTDGAGTFVTTACEDQGVLDVLTIYGAQGKVDPKRILILRTASNYSREPDGADPVLREFAYGGGAAAFEAAYLVGAPVVKALVAGWSRYETQTPKPGDR